MDEGFAQGYAAACAALIRFFDQPSMARDILGEHFNGERDIKKYDIDDYDATLIRPVLKEIDDRRKSEKQRIINP